MNKYFILSILVFGYTQIKSQTIEIGQDAEYIKSRIEWATRDHNKPDSDGRFSDARASWNVKYNNGQIVDVIACRENQMMLDLMMQVNACVHYIMENGKLAVILTQFENVSKEKLVVAYDKLYKGKKIGNLYYDDNFSHSSEIYLAKNGQATIEYRNADMNKIPLNLRNDIAKNRKEEIEATKKLKLDQEKEEQRRQEITSKVYDLKSYDSTSYYSVVECVKQNIKDYFEPAGNGNYNKNHFQDYFTLENGKNKSYRAKSTYNVKYRLKDNSRPSRTYGNVIVSGTSNDFSFNDYIDFVSGDDLGYSMFNKSKIKFSILKIDGYNVETEAKIENINIEYNKGISTIQIKKDGTFDFIEYLPNNDIIGKIERKIKETLKSETKGKYTVKYSVLNVMGDEKISVRIGKWENPLFKPDIRYMKHTPD